MRNPRSFTALGLIVLATRLSVAGTATVFAAADPASPRTHVDAGASQGAAGPSASGEAAGTSASPASAAPAAATPVSAAQAASTPAPAASPGSSVAAKTRLPRTWLPESNRVSLVLDPAKDSFSGRIEIAARVAAPVRELWLNAQNLTLSEATVSVGGTRWGLEVLPQEKDSGVVGLRSAREIPAGAAAISIDFAGKVDATETEGIFRQKEGDAWYVFSQFEAIAARKAFPCFDEPDSKVPWRLTLEVPKGLVALSNTPVASEKDTDHGTRVVAFQETPPLPSYLIAFAVGPFDVVNGGKSRRGTPIRVAVPKGRGGDTRYVIDTTAPILAQLEDYFGTPYPFAKLDLLAIPVTVGFGAMENPGLVTFNQTLLTARREDFTISYQRRFSSTTAHELAHQWFGDLVTLAWWDDLWLNEAFATWMAGRIIEQWKPEWDKGFAGVARVNGVIGSDSLQNARKIRQPIESENDIKNAFDGITYQKGASVIRMFERWAGETRFRDGVRVYLRKYAGKNATAADFLKTVGETVGRDVATPFSTFLDRPGAPLVSFQLTCEPESAPVVRMRQQRYLPLGSEADARQTWQVPVCVQYPAGAGIERDCALVTQASAELALTKAKSCPAWILPNDGLGYYRSELEGDLLRNLLDNGMKAITPPERAAVIGDVNALVRAGKADIGVALELAGRYAADESRQIATSAANIAEAISDNVPDPQRPNYERFIRKMFGARARAAGWTPGKGEDDDTRLLRTVLLPIVVDQGNDRELAAPAQKLALTWLENHDAIDPDMVTPVLETAALYGDQPLFDRLHETAKTAKDRRDRQRLLNALAGFRDPEIARKAVSLVLTDEFDVRDAMRILQTAQRNRENRRMIYDFVKQNYDALAARLPKQSTRSLIRPAVGLCDATLRSDAGDFFGPRMAKLPGGPRDYNQAMEQLDLCVTQRAAQRPSIVAFLEKY
jgi:alanyl aminopeptidase